MKKKITQAEEDLRKAKRREYSKRYFSDPEKRKLHRRTQNESRRKKRLGEWFTLELRCDMRRGGLCRDARTGDAKWKYRANSMALCITKARSEGWDVEFKRGITNGLGDCPMCTSSASEWASNDPSHRHMRPSDEQT